MSEVSHPLSNDHVRQLIRIAGVPALVSPVILYGAILLGRANDWEVVDTARVSSMIVMLVLFVSVARVLFVDQPAAQRKRGFVIFWFTCAAFLNLIWQLPLSLFRSWVAIDAAPHTWGNLAKFAMWWGYGFADHHYGRVTTWMMSEELLFLLSIGLSVYGLVLLRRGGQDARAFVWMGLGGATQSYNATLYIVENGLVGGYSNIPEGSIVSQILYWGFNPFWAGTSLVAAVYCFQFVLGYAEQSAAERG